MTDEPSPEGKRTWSPPAVVVYGDVEEITLNGAKRKVPGCVDDFGYSGTAVSDCP